MELPQKSKLALVVAAIPLCFGIQGCHKQETSQKYYSQAQEYYQKGDTKSAVIQLKNALEKDPNNGEARYLLGVIYNQTGDGASAEKELRRALQAGYDKQRVTIQKGRALLAQQEFQRVLDEIAVPQGADKQTAAEILAVRGNAQLALGKQEDARNSFNEALKQKPLPEVYRGLARLALVERDANQAMAQVDDAIAKAPQDKDSLLMKAELLRVQGKQEEAISTFKDVLKIDPRNVPAHLGLASIYLGQDKLDAARTELNELKKFAQNNLIARHLSAFIDFKQKDYAAARDQLQQVLKVAPDYLPSVLLFGAVSYALGSYEQAEANLAKVVEKAPSNRYARKLLAATRLKTKQPDEALETLRPLLGKDSTDAQALGLAGEIYLYKRDFSKATDYFDRASAIDPASAAVRTELGLSRLAGGDTSKALIDLESAAEMDSQQYRADLLLVMAHLKSKQYDKVLEAISGLEKKLPNNPLVFNLRGVAYLGKQDVTSARKNFEQALAIDGAYYPAALNLARLDLEAKQPEQARKRLEGVLTKDKNNVPVMVALAQIAGGAAKEQEMVSWLERAAKANASALQPRQMLTRYYLLKRDFPKALAVAREAQTANPSSPEALDLLGSAQLAAGETDNALVTYGRLVEQTPKNPLSYYRLATAQSVAKNGAAAKEALGKALQLKPDFLEAEVMLIALEVKEKAFAAAQEQAQKVQNQYAKLPIGYELEGDIFAAQEQFLPAAAAYGKAARLGNTGTLVMKMHRAMTAGGKAAEADAVVTSWLKEHPTDMLVRSYWAEALMRTGQTKDASQQYETMLKQDPNNLLALNNLAWLYDQAKDPRALSTAERAYKQRPDNPAIVDTFGWLLVQNNKPAQGLALLRTAVSKAPDNGEIRYHLAVALMKNGDQARAKDELERLLATGISFPQEKEAKGLLAQLKRDAR